jgi:hypothetical protein
MSRDIDITPVFAGIDAMDAGKFVAHLTSDVRLPFVWLGPATQPQVRAGQPAGVAGTAS